MMNKTWRDGIFIALMGGVVWLFGSAWKKIKKGF